MEPKNFLIIGGTSGIGLELVKVLRGGGHQVVVGSRSAGRRAAVEGTPQVVFDTSADSASPEGLPESLSGMAYCPGTIRLKPFQRLTREDFLEDLQVNYLGAVQAIQACLPNLKQSPEGASILLFSTVAVRTGMPFHASVAGAKGAVEGLTRALAAEFAPRIRVNAIAPSLTDTPLAGGLLSSEDKRRAAAERHPLKRIGRPADAARLAALLLTGEGGWITGQVIAVDGGMGALRVFR